MLNISALYLSQKRLNEVLDRVTLPVVARLFSLSAPENAGLHRTAILSDYEDAVLAWLLSANYPTLGQLVAENRVAPGVFFTHLGVFSGSGVLEAADRHHRRLPLRKEALLKTNLDNFKTGLTLTVQAHPENYTTASAAGEMSSKKRLFLVGRITDCETNQLRAQAYVIGHLHEEPRQGTPSVDRFGRLNWHMEIFPTQIDNFSAAADVKSPTTAELAKIQSTAESDVKQAFASIAGEPFVPKDWGGEKSDLCTTQLRIDGHQVATAFAFKGRSKAKKMTVADLGKNGDQISRLFSEPSDFVVLQHCHEVTSAVRDHMRAFATRIGHLRPFCIIDGADTVRILKAYKKLDFGDTALALTVGKQTEDSGQFLALPPDIAVNSSGPYAVNLCVPANLSAEEIAECVDVIKKGDAVDLLSAKKELPLAWSVAVVRAGTKIVGVGAIKRQRRTYAEKTARSSGVSFPIETLELGYVAVLPDHRGHKLSSSIVEALLSRHKGRLFATTSNAWMRNTLKNAGFVNEGKEWPGRKKQMVSFWKRN
jgi:GNAT superfamily N-acetyltransferase